MGLDMYLTAEKFVSGYDHNKDENFNKILDLLKIDNNDVDRGMTVGVNVGYWRKANAIHSWFVENTQNGEDDCRRTHVSRDQLEELRADCANALAAYNIGDRIEAENILAPSSGFFFGSTEIDDGYKQDLDDTIKIIDKCLSDKFKDFDFYYQASW
jgi:hypothetical protein